MRRISYFVVELLVNSTDVRDSKLIITVALRTVARLNDVINLNIDGIYDILGRHMMRHHMKRYHTTRADDDDDVWRSNVAKDSKCDDVAAMSCAEDTNYDDVVMSCAEDTNYDDVAMSCAEDTNYDAVAMSCKL